MQLFSHVMVGSSDLERSKKFYDAVLGTLGVKPGFVDRYRVFWRTKTGTFGVSIPIDGKPCTFANGGTIGFACETTEQADAWHAATPMPTPRHGLGALAIGDAIWLVGGAKKPSGNDTTDTVERFTLSC